MINYIILVHENPLQLIRLINKLSDNDVTFYIHIDKLVDSSPFLEATKTIKNIHFIGDDKREEGIWCGIGLVKATINALNQIVKEGRNGYCILLSGQDYPIKNNNHIKTYLSENYGKNFIETFNIPTDNWSHNGMDRINNYKFNLSNKRGHFVIIPTIYQLDFYGLRTIKSIIKLIMVNKFRLIFNVLKKRKHPIHMYPKGGSAWWGLSIETVKKVIYLLEKNPDFLTYHKYTFIPDEFFFQTIVSHLNEKSPELMANSLTFVDWGQEDSIGAPNLRIEDFNKIINQPENILFARKFEYENDSEILSKLDSHLTITK
jgi:hypothetical protein